MIAAYVVCVGYFVFSLTYILFSLSHRYDCNIDDWVVKREVNNNNAELPVLPFMTVRRPQTTH